MLDSNRPTKDYIHNFWISLVLLIVSFIPAVVVQFMVDNETIKTILWVIFAIFVVLFVVSSVGYYHKMDIFCRSNNGNASNDTSTFGAGL
jgi:hypothetical protein